jgi:hypothetical protein
MSSSANRLDQRGNRFFSRFRAAFEDRIRRLVGIHNPQITLQHLDKWARNLLNRFVFTLDAGGNSTAVTTQRIDLESGCLLSIRRVSLSTLAVLSPGYRRSSASFSESDLLNFNPSVSGPRGDSAADEAKESSEHGGAPTAFRMGLGRC